MKAKFVILLLLIITFTGCDNREEIEYYQVPKHVTVDSVGHFSAKQNFTVLDSKGEYTIDATIPKAQNKRTVKIIFKNYLTGKKYVTECYSSKLMLTAVYDSVTIYKVNNRMVEVDITGISEKKFNLEYSGEDGVMTGSFWDEAFGHYRPFSVTNTIYSDSYIFDWYGLGFLLYLVDLFITFFAILLDLFLIITIGTGLILEMIFGLKAAQYAGVALVIGIKLWIICRLNH